MTLLFITLSIFFAFFFILYLSANFLLDLEEQKNRTLETNKRTHMIQHSIDIALSLLSRSTSPPDSPSILSDDPDFPDAPPAGTLPLSDDPRPEAARNFKPKQ